ncbi:MAG TPA: hypothetical protein VNA25_30435 [Phycisphaerae bacterium]|nr:hypothetical protein [Phycisphaerae bacterium]
MSKHKDKAEEPLIPIGDLHKALTDCGGEALSQPVGPRDVSEDDQMSLVADELEDLGPSLGISLSREDAIRVSLAVLAAIRKLGKPLTLGDVLCTLIGGYTATGKDAVVLWSIGRELYQAMKRRVPHGISAEEMVLLRKAVAHNCRGPMAPEGLYRTLIMGQVYEKIGTSKSDMPAPPPAESE